MACDFKAENETVSLIYVLYACFSSRDPYECDDFVFNFLLSLHIDLAQGHP
jgi:hypothetical protein